MNLPLLSNLFLAFVVLFVAFYWLNRQKKRALDNFAVFSAFIQFPQITPQPFGFVLYISGLYKNRKFGWDYNIFHDKRDSQIYIEPKCDIKPKAVTFSYPKPTPSTYLRGKRVYFSMSALRSSVYTVSIDPVPILTKENAKYILDELANAAEIVEKNPSL